MKKKIDSDQLSLLFQGRLGLIVGPSLTLGAGFSTDVSGAVAEKFEVSPAATYLDTCDAAVAKGATPADVRDVINSVIGARAPAALTSRLARVRWGSVLSFAPDTTLEDMIRAEAAKKSFWPSGVIIDRPDIPIPPRTIPLLKLLGTAGRETLVTSKYDYTRARSRWRTALRVFLDLVKNASVVCLGMSEMPWALADILGELSGLPVFINTLVALEDDPLALSGELDRMLDTRTTLATSRGTAGDLIQAAEKGLVTPQGIRGQAPQVASGSPDAALNAFADLAVVVPTEATVRKQEREQLFEMLFAPTTVYWDPFVHKLDFPRSAGAALVAEVDANLTKGAGGAAVVLVGAAATGKTVLLKRVALDLATKGHVVLWLRPYFYPDASSRVGALFKALAQTRKNVCIIQDDPHGLGSLRIRELAGAARTSGVEATFVVAVRSSEWATREPAELLGSLNLRKTVDLEDGLDETEWQALEAYLTELGISQNATDARKQLELAKSRSARDTLAMLYLLIPQTRGHIQQSIKDEYFRLGDQAGFRRVVLGQAQHSSELLKRAYEMVAVADKYRASVPVEVLVSALDVDYQAWLNATTNERGAWGLLYADENEEAETFVYRTRNNVVTKVLVDALNGGALLSKSGEVRVLRRMLEACTGSHPAYREFAARILAGNDVLKDLEFADGLELFERALAALPYSDKTILHHKGIWIRQKGQDPIAALKVFAEAVDTAPAPYARRVEADEHIFTSSAAAVIDAIKAGLVTVDEGKEKALNFLARSRSSSFFNASAVHAYARLVIELSDRIGVETPDSKHLASTALADVDRTILTIEATPTREMGEEIAMLRQVRDRIVLKTVDPREVQTRAIDLWEGFQNQDGFCLAARAMLHGSRKTAKGASYKEAFEYTTLAIERVKGAGVAPATALHEVRIQTLYEWRIHSWKKRPRGGFIHWEMFYDDLLRVLPSVGNSPLFRYFEGLALAHLGKWNDSAGAFGQVRGARVPPDLLWARRDMLLDAMGDPRELQGIVRRVNDKVFVKVDEVGTDFLAERDAKWPRTGEITTCYVEFAFGGSTAIPRRV